MAGAKELGEGRGSRLAAAEEPAVAERAAERELAAASSACAASEAMRGWVSPSDSA